MREEKLVSIIVPVYNAEPYLDRCVGSLLAQTHRNIEVLLVNDGSADDSLAVCRKYEAQDPRVRVFTQENRGQSAARNVALDHATGEFLAFVDADDHIAPNMIEMLLENLLRHDVDFVGAGYYSEAPDGKLSAPAGQGNYTFDVPMDRDAICRLLPTAHSDGNLLWFCWRNLYRKSVVDRAGMRFVEQNIIEDPIFNLEYLANAGSMVLIREPLYYYVMTPNSTIRKPGKKNYLRKLEDSHNIKQEIYRKYGFSGFEKSMDDYTLNHTLTLLISNLLSLRENVRREVRAVIESPMIRSAFANGTLDGSNTALMKLFKFLIRHKACGCCTLLIRV